MAPWKKGERHKSWASNGNISVVIFGVLFVVWLAFQVWARMPGGPPAPTGLDPMVMAALGVAVTSKSVEKRQEEITIVHRQDKSEERQIATDDKVRALEDVAKEAHPDVVAEHKPPLETE